MRILSFVFLLICGAAPALSQALEVRAHGWTITADARSSTISIEHARFGTIAAGARLGLDEQGRVEPLSGWTAKNDEGAVRISSATPPTAWRFEAEENALRIACTRSSGVITGNVPAGRERLVVRLMDATGTPVNWVGTTEINNSFGGQEVSNRSYLPARNPECMYFSLGPASGLNFHSLYDRFKDNALDFPEGAKLVRSPGNRDSLDLQLPVPGHAWMRVIPDYYTKVLGAPVHVPFDESHFPSAPSVWCSWTGYYADVTEEDIVTNTEWLARNLRGYGFQYVQLDDGYDRGSSGEHYWIEHWDTDKFPHGPRWLTSFIKSKGLHAGLWLVPNAYAGAVQSHPAWYLRNRKGELVRDYRTPALDSSNPEVLQFVRRLFTTLKGWGFEYYKFDGEHAIPKYAPDIDHTRLYDSKTDPLEIYRRRLQAIRESVGPETFIEGCPGGTPLNGIAYFNSYFTGDDVYNSWQGMYPFFSSVSANAFLNHILVYVMPGEGIELAPVMSVEEAAKRMRPPVVKVASTRETPMKGFGTTLHEARTLATYASLTGVVYSLASILPELTEERIRLLKATLPTIPVLPSDLFSRGNDMNWTKFKVTTPDEYIHNYPEILDLKVAGPSGEYDVVGFTNWTSRPVTREISLTGKLGLPQASRFIAFDFWGETLVPVSSDGAGNATVSLEIQPHDTRVLLVHAAHGGPQYVGTSRHISGAYGVTVNRDGDGKGITGQSLTVAGEPYTLWFLAGNGAVVKAESAGKPLAVRQTHTGGLLSAAFDGQAAPVTWSLR